jgi:hypothetical protein
MYIEDLGAGGEHKEPQYPYFQYRVDQKKCQYLTLVTMEYNE